MTPSAHEITQLLVEWRNGKQAALDRRRHLMVDPTSSRHYARRGGWAHHIPMEEWVVLVPGRDTELLALDGALGRLTALDRRPGVRLV